MFFMTNALLCVFYNQHSLSIFLSNGFLAGKSLMKKCYKNNSRVSGNFLKTEYCPFHARISFKNKIF